MSYMVIPLDMQKALRFAQDDTEMPVILNEVKGLFYIVFEA